MSFGQSISTVFSKYATFSGRARRSEFWYWHLFLALMYVVLPIVDSAVGLQIGDGVGSPGWLSLVFAVAVAIPTIAVTFRRLHDTGRSGWWWLLSLICGIGALILLIFCIGDSKLDNEYGPNPKGAGGLATA